MKKNILFLKLALLLSLLGAFLPETSISMGMEVQNLSSDEAYVVYNTQNGTLTFYADGKRESHNLSFEEVYEIGYEDDTPLWYDTGASSVVIDKSFANFRPTTCRNWFKGYHYEAFEGMEYLNTSNVTDMSSMFEGCPSERIDVTHFDTRKVTNMSRMFYDCYNLQSLDVSKFATFAVMDMSSMFEHCSYLTTIDVTHFDTRNVMNMSKMFSLCYKLTSLDLSGFVTGNVTNMSQMFSDCRALTSLNLSGLDTHNVVDMSGMFLDCYYLQSLDVSGFNSSNVTNMSKMFANCLGLTVLDVSKFKTGKVVDMSRMFDNCSLLTILDVSNFDTGNVVDMNNMFHMCEKLTSLDISHFSTGKVTNMNNMFGDCKQLTSLDMSNFDTGNVVDMNNMFASCEHLAALNLSNFITSNVTNMGGMFSFCKRLTSLDVSNYDTSNVTDMSEMFMNCSVLTTLDISNFSTGKVANMMMMFYGCNQLTSLDVSNFNTENVTNMYGMFEGCSHLKSLDLSKFNTRSVEDMNSMFKSCTSLITILVGDYWEVPKNSSDNMFSGCTNVTGENGTTYDENHVGGKYAHVDGGSDDPGYLSSEWPDVTKLVSGNGTKNLPYLITRTAELDMLSMNVNSGRRFEGQHFKLCKNLYYDEVRGNYTAIGYWDGMYGSYFDGFFDGNGHCISGIHIHKSGRSEADSYQGVFGWTGKHAVVKNLVVSNSKFIAHSYTGAIVGKNEGKVENCHVLKGSDIHAIAVNTYYHGGVVGYNSHSGMVSGCSSSVIMKGIDSGVCGERGGIIGLNEGDMSNCLSLGCDIYGTTHVGALVGRHNSGTLSHNYYSACNSITENGTLIKTTDIGCGGNGSASSDIDDNDGSIPALRDDTDNTKVISLLSARSTYLAENGFSGATDISISGRMLNLGGLWNTLCVPFDIPTFAGTLLDGATVATLDNASFENGILTLNFMDVTSIEAGKPYIVKFEKSSNKQSISISTMARTNSNRSMDTFDGEAVPMMASHIYNAVFKDVTVSIANNPVVINDLAIFQGTFSPITFSNENDNILYLDSDNTLRHPESDTNINAFRAYFKVGSSSGDVNGDGMVSVSDVTMLVDHILGNTNDGFIIKNADITGDGVISVSDVTHLVDIILHTDTILKVVVLGADGITFEDDGDTAVPARAGGLHGK